MPGVSIHVVDITRGMVATGMQVAVYRISSSGKLELIARGPIGMTGFLDKPELEAPMTIAKYRVVFHVGDFYRLAGVALPPVAFLDIVQFEFGVADPEQHYHLPFKCTPWGYSCFRA